ncbi:hypothetical protein F2Q70_00045702 [Brassica cretica]|uniref:mRNA decay factor PAT1 domain-containing protein n=1 Tax=Brassica cretica TaxID=69181 RepID=A0A8S9KLZ2_BRACR|nr:hypothetical protein F2Q70_00045702 [Brassica cretica]
MDTNQAPGIDDLKKVADNPSGDSMFDASQYAFFGNDVVEEVELGGLEEEEDEILSFNGIREGFSFDKEEVEDSRPLSDVDDLATTFSKLNRDPEVYRNTGPIIDRRPGQNSLAPDWTYREELPDWNGQKLLDSDAIKDDKAWSGQPFSTLDPKRTTPHLEPQRQLHQNHNQQQFPSDPILVPKSSFGSYPPPSSILPDQCSGHPNVAPYHSGGAQMGSPNFSQFPTLQPQLAGMHHGSPQRAGNVPQFRPDLPLNNRPQAQWMNNALLQQPSQDDFIFQRIISLPKGRKLLVRYLQLIFPGSDLMRIVCMGIFRHLRSLFGVLSSDPDIAKATNKLANVVNLCIHKMELGPISACLAAVSCSSEQPPLRPLGSPVGDGASTVLKSTLDRASELLRGNNFNNAGMGLWRASFNEFYNLLMRYCISKYDGIMQSLNSQLPPEFASEISDAAAQAIVREMPIELLRSSFPHIDEQQKRLLMEFLKRSMLGSQKTEPAMSR